MSGFCRPMKSSRMRNFLASDIFAHKAHGGECQRHDADRQNAERIPKGQPIQQRRAIVKTDQIASATLVFSFHFSYNSHQSFM